MSDQGRDPVAGLQPVVLYDTTLRDGTQGENITLSLADKTFPVTAATPLLGPGRTGGTPATEVRYGLSDPKKENFEDAEEEPGNIVGTTTRTWKAGR